MFGNVLLFIIVLSVLILVHEFGHFIVARLCGVGVEKFSLGFGPKLIGKKIGITDYRISAIPLGGFVKMVGDEPDAEIDPADIPLSFLHKSLLKRISIVAAGPFFNILLAIILFFSIFFISGVQILLPSIGSVKDNSPAHSSGLTQKDLIMGIDGKKIDSWEEMSKIISNSNGKTLSLSVKRNDREININVKPHQTKDKNLFGEDIERYIIGITPSGDFLKKRLNIFEALYKSAVYTYNISELTIVSIGKIIKGTVSAKNLGGPIMIAQMVDQHAKEGPSNLIIFVALISINLAILNFLPIPVLDGGHLLFFFIEAIIRRPVNTKVRMIAQQAGAVILIMLMIIVFYNDITRIFIK